MKLTSITNKPHGLKAFTFWHEIKGEMKEITTLAMNEDNGRAKAWKRVSELYKDKTFKTNVEQAIAWWQSLGNKAKDRHASKRYNRNFITLSDEEIEEIWRRAPDYDKPVPTCEYCGCNKLNPYGICNQCGKFPSHPVQLSNDGKEG